MSEAFDYYPETDTLIVRLQRAPQSISEYKGANFIAVTGERGELVELEIRDASRFLARALAEAERLVPETISPETAEVSGETQDAD